MKGTTYLVFFESILIHMIGMPMPIVLANLYNQRMKEKGKQNLNSTKEPEAKLGNMEDKKKVKRPGLFWSS